MPDVQNPVLKNGGCKNTGHPAPRRLAFSKVENVIVRCGNSLSEPAGDGAGLLVQPGLYGIDRPLSGDLACRFASHTIGDDEYAPLCFAENPVFVILPFPARVCSAKSFPAWRGIRIFHLGHLERIVLT
jgi:hypothetical protein